jgi:transcriptional regulator of acetoin/glycerol metabolism
MKRDWPGNVRQLRRVVSAARGPHYNRLIRKVDLPDPSRPNPPTRRLTRLELAERDAIAAALVAAGGNKRAAAAQLDVSRSTLYRKISALGLDA